MTEDEFIEELNKLKINPTEKQILDLKKYYSLLIEWNNKINLTRIIDKEEVYLKHFYDSLTIVKVVNLEKIETLLDFGTGAGFPGMVLKIIYPHLKVTLLDSLNKRIIFLNEVIDKLNLKDIETIHTRIEDYKEKKFDLITTRAVANLSKLLDYTNSIITKDTQFIPLKGHIKKELDDVENSNRLAKYNLKITKKVEFMLPNENSTRTLLIIEKNRN